MPSRGGLGPLPRAARPAGSSPRAGTARPVLVIPWGRTAEFLARQPVSVLDDQDLACLLNRLGLRTLGDLAALPAEDGRVTIAEPADIPVPDIPAAAIPVARRLQVVSTG